MKNKTEAALINAEKHCELCPKKNSCICQTCPVGVLKKVLCSAVGNFLIYAIDFDGTIVEEKWPKIGAPKKATINFIRQLRKRGHKWILFTMREGEYLREALDFLAINDLLPDAVNDNLPERVKLWRNNPRKIYADVYVDDHNAGGLVLPEIPILKG